MYGWRERREWIDSSNPNAQERAGVLELAAALLTIFLLSITAFGCNKKRRLLPPDHAGESFRRCTGVPLGETDAHLLAPEEEIITWVATFVNIRNESKLGRLTLQWRIAKVVGGVVHRSACFDTEAFDPNVYITGTIYSMA